MGLFNSTVLDVAIGVVFVYLLLAILCTTVNEWIAGITGARAHTLAQGIKQLLDEQKGMNPTRSFLEEFYSHPLISGMMAPRKNASEEHPSYLPSRTFASAVIDLATSGTSGSLVFADLENGVKNLPPGDVRTALLTLLQNASGDLDRAQQNIEQWFDDTMERVSGWYKRRTQLVTIAVATVLTIGTNADSVRIAHVLWTSGTQRTLLVQRAKTAVGTPNASVVYPNKNDPLHPVFKPSRDDMDTLRSVLGWPGRDDLTWGSWPSRIVGWFLSIVAISLGAPFWFDTLSKLMNVRNAGQKPKKGNPNGKPDKPRPQTSAVTEPS